MCVHERDTFLGILRYNTVLPKFAQECVLKKQTSNIQSRAWNVKYIRDTKLEVSGDVSIAVYLVSVSGLVGLLESLNGTLNKCQCGVTEAQEIWSQAKLLSRGKSTCRTWTDFES